MAIPGQDDDAVPGGQGAGPVSAAAGAAAALQAAHARRRTKKSCWPCRARWPRPPNQIFRQLNDADLKFGTVKNEKGELVELSHAIVLGASCTRPSASVRKTAFHQYYGQFAAHENTLAATLAGSIQRDVYYAKARNYPSALAASLFPDNVPLAVYDNLIASVHRHLPAAVSLLRPAAAEDEAARTFTTTTPTCRS